MNTEWRRRRRDMMDRPQQVDDAPWQTAILSLVAGALLTVTTGLAVMLQLERFGPAVGGIIPFKVDAAASEGWSVHATKLDPTSMGLPAPSTGPRCVLTPGIMGRHGGSLVIEARQLSRPPVYRVHWSGGPTSHGTNGCGNSADLLLERAELMRLVNFAGGFNGGFRMVGP